MSIKKLFQLMVSITLLLMLSACTTDVVRKKPSSESSASINARLGLAYMQQGDNETALLKLQRALEQDPNLVAGHHYIAELYRQLDAPEEAAKHYKAALKLAPNDYSLQNNHGVFLCDQGDYAAAEKSFLMAIQNAPVHKARYEFYENLAQCMLRKPDRAKAEKYFRVVLDDNPRAPVTLYQMALLSFEDGKYLRSRAFFQRFAEVSAHTPETLWLGVRIERKLGDIAAADKYAKLLKTNYPLADETVTLMESELQ